MPRLDFFSTLVGAVVAGVLMACSTTAAEKDDKPAVTTTDEKGETPAGAAVGESEKPAQKAPDCVYVGTPNDVVDRMLELARIQATDLVYDPGCGDGRMVVSAAKKYGCRGVGFEIVPELIDRGRKLAAKRKVEKLVEIKDKDIFKLDYRDADVIVMYLLPDMIVKLLPQFEKMKDGSRIVAHDYGIRGVKADKVETMKSNEDNVSHTLYLYTLPLVHEKTAEDR